MLIVTKTPQASGCAKKNFNELDFYHLETGNVAVISLSLYAKFPAFFFKLYKNEITYPVTTLVSKQCKLCSMHVLPLKVIYYLYTEILNFLLSFSKLMQFITATLLQKLPVTKRNPI